MCSDTKHLSRIHIDKLDIIGGFLLIYLNFFVGSFIMVRVQDRGMAVCENKTACFVVMLYMVLGNAGEKVLKATLRLSVFEVLLDFFWGGF
jgi:hypothetical protein